MTTTEQDQSGDCPDDVESVEEEETPTELKNFPNIFSPEFSSLNKQQRNTEWLALLPPTVKRRIKALKKIQFEVTNIEAKFFKDVHDLECKYHRIYEPLYEKRSTIVNGDYEPTDDEAQWPSDDEDNALPDALKDKIKLEEEKNLKEGNQEKGIPDFWLTIFRNCNILSEMVQPHDVPILKHLKDIKLECKEEPLEFTLKFHFSPNEYFTNTILTKQYLMKCSPDEDDPFNFEGPEIYKCIGCTIDWNKGKNVTLKTIKKKQKHKSRGVVRTVTKTVQNDSFFNFFTPPVIPEGTKDEDVDEDLRNLLTSDFEIGHYLRERIIPRAVIFYTGEGCDSEEDFEEEEEEEDDEEEDGESDGGKENARNKQDQNCKQQ